MLLRPQKRQSPRPSGSKSMFVLSRQGSYLEGEKNHVSKCMDVIYGESSDVY